MEAKKNNDLKSKSVTKKSGSASSAKKTTTVKKSAAKSVKNDIEKKVIKIENDVNQDAKNVALKEGNDVEISNIGGKSKESFLSKRIGPFPIFAYAIVAICVVIFIFILLVISILSLSSVDNMPKYPIVYTTSDRDANLSGKNAKSKEVDITITSDTHVYYANDDTSKFLYLTNNSLFMVKTKNGEKDKIASNVDTALFSDNDKYVVYLTNNGDLYSYNYKKYKICKNVDQIYAVINNKVYFEKNDNLYVVDIKGKKDSVKIDSDIFGFTVNENNKTALYRKYDNATYDVYLFNFGSSKSKKVAENVSSIIDVSDDFKELIYLEEAKSTSFSLKKVLKDDLSIEDEEYMEKYESSARDSMSSSELSEYYYVKARDDIREYVDKEKYEIQGYDVYYVKNGKKKQIASGVSEVLSSDIDSLSVAYVKSTLDTSKKLAISDYRYLSGFKTDVKSLLKSKLYYKKSNGKEIEIASKFDDASVSILNKNKMVYVLKNGTKYSLYSGKVFGKKLKSEVITTDVKGLELISYNDGVIYLSDYNSSHHIADLYYITDSFKPKKIATDVYTSNISVKDDNLYYYINYESNNGDLYRFNGSRAKLLLEDVTKIYYLRDNYMYVLNDCNSKFACDLSIYTGHKKMKKVASDVTGIVSNNKIS